MTTPYDVYVNMLNKQAVDALIPGQVGMGINSGHADSAAEEASSSVLARNRADMQAMALISGSADAGAGYSNPAPATSPSLQMQADVKAAAVIDEAIKFAEYVYTQTKEANFDPAEYAHLTPEAAPGFLANAGARARQMGSSYMAAAKGVPGLKGRALQAAAIGAPIAAAGGAGYAGYSAMQGEPEAVPEEALKTAYAVLESLGLQAVEKQALNLPFGMQVGRQAPSMGQRLDKATAATMGAAQRLAANPYAQAAALATGGAAAGAGGMMAYDSMKEAGERWDKTKDFVHGHGGRQVMERAGQARDLAMRNPKTSMGIGAAGAMGMGAVGMHEYAAHMQAAQMQAAQEQGLARPADASLDAMKEASLQQAAQMGQAFALRQLGLA